MEDKQNDFEPGEVEDTSHGIPGPAEKHGVVRKIMTKVMPK